ncbi:MAG: M20/M25/M40 family metallo-hydrolase [Betaproteobacteria bacterium]
MSNFSKGLLAGLSLVVVTLVGLPVASPLPSAVPAADASRITDEALTRSQLMDTLGYLTDEIGPRLTNSPNFRRAAAWTRDRFAAWGLQNAHLEPWGPFGRGWSVTRFSAEMIAPQEMPLIAMPKAWSPAAGQLTADAVLLEATTTAELEKYRGHLAHRIVLVGRPRPLAPRFAPLATRYSADDLAAFASDRPFPPNNENFAPPPSAGELARRRFEAERLQFLADEHVSLIVEPSGGGFDGGTIAVQAASVPQPADTPRAERVYAWNPRARTVPQVVVATEHYNRMARLLARGDAVRLAVDLEVQFDDSNLMSSQTLADVPGSDLADQIVMVGAHLDSWHAGTGATDNAAGVAVVMETARLFEALRLRPRRTVRFALWGGEETGGGARPYVEAHIARLPKEPEASAGRSSSPGQFVKLPDYDKYTAYFNIDAGTGKVRGVYLAGNAALKPIFRSWLEPFARLGASTLTMNGDWGSDFEWFDRVGVPIVSFIQDEIEYDTRTHHTNMDVLDRIQPDDLKQAAAIMTTFVYEAAMRDQGLPRK